MHSNRIRRHVLGSTILAASLLSLPAAAQEGSATGLEEIVVTANKRAERMQVTPVAVSAINSEVLEARGVTDVGNLGQIAPNVSAGSTPSSTNTLALFIRGVGLSEPILTNDAPVGIYVDGVPIGRITGAIFDLVDLERIEVLRGPQGTLYGRNTTGGAVNLLTARPTRDFGVEAKLGFGNFGSWVARSRLDTGEFGDTGLSAKVSFVHKEHEGYVDNVNTPDSRDPGADDVNAVRAQLNFDRGDRFRANYAFDYSRQKGNAAAFQLTAARPEVLAYLSQSAAAGGAPALLPQDTRRGSIILDNDGPITTRIQGHTLNAEFDITDDLTVRSITGYRKWDDRNTGSDLDGNGGLRGLTVSPAILVPPNAFIPLGFNPVQLFHANNDRHQQQWSQELNFIGDIGDRFRYVVGGFYFKEKSRENNPQNLTLVLGTPAAPFGVNVAPALTYRHHNESKAVFAQGTFDVTEKLGVTGGVRYTKDNKRLMQVSPLARDISRSFSKVSWAASVDYKWTDDLMTFARVATGYKAGGINARATNSGYDPENLTSYEVGVKSEMLDRRVRLNAGLFYTRTKDLQVDQFAAGSGGATSITINAGKVNTKGFEVEATALLFEGFSVNGAFGYVDRNFKEYLYRDPATNTVRNIADQIADDYSAAKVTYNVGAQYDLPRFGPGLVTARLDWSYRGKMHYHPTSLTTPFNDQIMSDKVTSLDARLTWSQLEWNGTDLTLGFWVKNLTNNHQRLWGIDFGSLGYAGNTYVAPRTYGLELSAKF